MIEELLRKLAPSSLCANVLLHCRREKQGKVLVVHISAGLTSITALN